MVLKTDREKLPVCWKGRLAWGTTSLMVD